MGVVFVYSDQSLQEEALLLSERFQVVNYAEDPRYRGEERQVWLVRTEDQIRDWPLCKNETVPVLVVGDLSGESLVTEAWFWLKRHHLL